MPEIVHNCVHFGHFNLDNRKSCVFHNFIFCITPLPRITYTEQERKMGKGIYTYYKERLIEIGGNNRCLYLKNVTRKSAYDIGKLFEGRDDKVSELVEFLWSKSKYPLTLISEEESKEIVKNLGLPTRSRSAPDVSGLSGEDAKRALDRHAKNTATDTAKVIEAEIAKVKELKREIEEIEKETGRYELYIGYPFVFGSINQGINKTLIKAPLLLFPVKIEIVDETTVEIRRNESESIQLNRALIFAYAQAKKLNVEDIDLEFDDLSSFKNVKQVVDYLDRARIKVECANSKHIYNYGRFKEPEPKGELSVRYAAVMARFPLSNSIYNDYTLLEKKNLTNDAINELLRTGGKRGARRIQALERAKIKSRAKALKRAKRGGLNHSYTVKMLDYAQSEVVKKVAERGNMVIYGPPGTGKSQTIVNIITDAISKDKRVLVVSQKKAALDVVYSRLGMLNEKAMYITDETKEKKSFYERCFSAHQKDEVDSLVDLDALQSEYDDIEKRISQEENTLERIYHTLNDKRPFGLSLSEMYSSSYMLPKNSSEYSIYLNMLDRPELMSLKYKELSDALFTIKAKNLDQMYYAFVQAKEKNPLIDTMKPDLDIRTLSEVRGMLEEIQKSRKGLFNISKYPYTRQVLAYYSQLESRRSLDAVVNMSYKLGHEGLKSKREMRERFVDTISAIDGYVKEYDCLNRVMTRDGYISVIDNILRGNTSYIKLVHEALDNYITLRDVSKLMDSLDKHMLDVLNFAYTTSKNYQNYTDIIGKIPVVRIYHEVTKYEELCKDDLAKTVDFVNITSRIYKLKESQLSVAYKICAGKNSREYRDMFDNASNSKDFLYQISKEQKFWPIRQTMDVYGDFILALFPCWLLSPENVSSILPLKKNMFDVVIFDEASQVFIESTIPTIYRGKNIVVAGDAKQLRPSATFMKRYMGADPDAQDDYSVQAALEVESLLDLAVARYDSSNLTYHYRSRHQELIDFSNSAFYSSNLQVAPNISTNKDSRPIERYKVKGTWIDRTNPTEAEKIVQLLKHIFLTRRNNESIGIITFNSDQQTCIADAIDKEARKNAEFRSSVMKERYRMDGGEDTSLFIKNLENVQGDERDIIIFSIGYAPNEQGKLYTNFGSLSSEGGENRLNVAITRAKSKIIVVTSIEPEDLKVDTSKHLGPKLLREYLAYVRAVSENDAEHVKAILTALDPSEKKAESLITTVAEVEEQIKERLEKQGYKVHTGLGNKNNRISLAVYDEKSDRYLVGVELDKDAFASSSSSMERDVYKPRFLEARGWTILRVWCRDWWISPTRVIKTITNLAEKNRQKTEK